MHVSLNRRQKYRAVVLYLRGGLTTCSKSLSFHEGDKVVDSFFHHTCTLDHLGEEHLPAAEVVTDDGHAFHERTLDHLQRSIIQFPCLLGVFIYEIYDTLDESVFESLLDRLGPPLLDLLVLLDARARLLLLV